MASSQFGCSITQGFNFQKDSQELVGHLVSMSIGGTALTADLELTVPTDLSASKVVGVIEDISFNGGYADPIWISANVSTANQKAVALLTHTSLSKTDVEFQFNIYQYDPVNKVFYLAYHSNSTTLKGLVLKQGGELSLSISPDADARVGSPLNYNMQIGIMPQSSAQSLAFAVSNSDKFAKQWGVANA